MIAKLLLLLFIGALWVFGAPSLPISTPLLAYSSAIIGSVPTSISSSHSEIVHSSALVQPAIAAYSAHHVLDGPVGYSAPIAYHAPAPVPVAHSYW